MPQFLIKPEEIEGTTVTLKAQEAKHLTKVLRYKKGETLWVTDGESRYLALIEEIGSKEATLRLFEKQKPILKATAPALGIALLKHDHFEWVLQKSVELGVDAFFPFVSERTIPHYREQTTPKKIERFEKIALEAAKQSGLVAIPKIHPPKTFSELTAHFKNFTAVLIAWEQEKESSFHSTFETIDPSRLLLLIGPEGGFSNEEVFNAEKAGAKKLSLGRQILRSETAATVALTLCQYELGNL